MKFWLIVAGFLFMATNAHAEKDNGEGPPPSAEDGSDKGDAYPTGEECAGGTGMTYSDGASQWCECNEGYESTAFGGCKLSDGDSDGGSGGGGGGGGNGDDIGGGNDGGGDDGCSTEYYEDIKDSGECGRCNGRWGPKSSELCAGGMGTAIGGGFVTGVVIGAELGPGALVTGLVGLVGGAATAHFGCKDKCHPKTPTN